MDSPLGSAIGNAIEVRESVDILQNKTGCPMRDRVRQLCIELAARVVTDATGCPLDQARSEAMGALASGDAMQRWDTMIRLQGGRPDWLDHLRIAPETICSAPRAGSIASIDCVGLGEAVIRLGGGRTGPGQTIDHSVGVALHVGVGQTVDIGQPLLSVHGDADRCGDLAGCMEIVDQPADAPELIAEVITASATHSATTNSTSIP